MIQRCCCWCWALAIALLLAGDHCCAAAPSLSQLAAQLYPNHTVLQLPTRSTSSIAAAIAAARKRLSQPSSSFLVILASSNTPLVVDKPLVIGPEEAWALATPAGLQAAADGTALGSKDLLTVRCSALAKGSFFVNSEPFAALELLGLSVDGCPGSALDLNSGGRLLLSNTHLKGSNVKKLVEDGGAALLAEIDEVKLVNSACSGNYVLYNGGCINGQKLGHFTALNSSFHSNWKSAEEVGGRFKGGGALYFESLGAMTITNCDFAHNSALYGSGGSLFCSMCGDVLVTNSRFTNNSAAESGGCMFAGEVALLTVTDCNFTANGQVPGAPDTWTADGGAIATYGTHITDMYPVNLILRRSTFLGNTADVGGAVIAKQFSSGKGRVEVQECRFAKNTGNVEAGAIMIEENQHTELLLNASHFEANTGGYGGAVSAYDADVAVTNCTFIHNKAETDGGALQLTTMQAAGSGNKLALAGCTLSDNTAGVYGGGVAVYNQGLVVRGSTFTANQGGSAGAVYLYNGPTATLLDSMFEGNIAEQGTAGAVRLDTVGQLDMQGITMNANEAWAGNGGAMQAARVSNALLSGLTVTDGYASKAGGGFSFLASNNVTLQGSTFFNNSAPLGAGLAADSSQLVLQAVNFSGNAAVEDEATEEDGRRRRLQQTVAADASTVVEYGSEVYASAAGGALLVQHSDLSMADSTLAGNTAGGDAGALFVQAPTGLDITNVTFESNVAETGTGAAMVIRGAGAAVAAAAKGCNFTGNEAKLGDGGAVAIESGLGTLTLACEGCNFQGNKAGRSGGAIAAAGPTSLTCSGCTSKANEAGLHGGWLHCSGCSSTTVTGGSSSSNKAAAAGGSVNCIDCGTFTAKQYDYSSNVAGSGGAIAVQSVAEVAVSDCKIDRNSAGNSTQQAVSSPLVRRVYGLPAAWQAMYGVGASTAELGCGAQGAGGGLCMSGAAAATIASNSITGNTGSAGGGLFVSADCAALPGGCSMGQVNVTDLTARDNSATEAGGALYTTTPAAVNIEGAGQDPNPASAEQHLDKLVRQLSQSNTVGKLGYGSAVASFPDQLSLMYPVQDEDAATQAYATEPAALGQQQQPKQTGLGRKLQQVALPPSLAGTLNDVAESTRDFRRQVDSTYQISSAPTSGTSATLQPFCPALAASITDQHSLSVSSDQDFDVPISVLDAFGSQARSGPGSDWVVALSQNSGDVSQLSGDLRGALSGGQVLLQGLSITAEPGSRLNLTLTAVPPAGSGDKPLIANIDVLVRPCLAGEYASLSRDAAMPGARSAATSVTCRTCAAPTFSFTAYAAGGAAAVNQTAACLSCPARGICVAGMVIPESGAYQSHPRSTVIRRCPNARACQRNSTATANLQGLQCAYRRYIDPADIDPRPYTAMQCSTGYAGPFCSSCYRPGRNLWLLEQLDGSGRQQLASRVGQQIANATARADTTAGRHEVYGKSSGRCERCPHMAVSWVGFLLSRVLDVFVIGLMALLWVLYGWLTQSAAATAFVQMKHQRMLDLRMWDSIFGIVPTTESSLGMPRPLSHAAGFSASTVGQRDVRPRSHGEQPRRKAGPTAEHRPMQVQQSVLQPVSGGPVAEGVPDGSRMPPPAAAGAAGSDTALGHISPFSLVQDAAQPRGGIAPTAGSVLQGVGSQTSGGLYHIYRSASTRWSSAVDMVNLLQQQYLQGFGHPADQQVYDDVLARQAAVMLMAVKHLACMAQVVLDGAQIAAVLLSLDLMFVVPDWVAKGLAGAVLTQAHTWQYVPFECLVPGSSHSSAAIAETILVTLLPIIYVLVLSPTLLWLLDLSKDSALVRQYVLAGTAVPAAAAAAAKDLTSNPAAPDDASPAASPSSSWLLRLWPAESGTWTLLAAIAVASMAYCYSLYVANLTSAFNCMSLSTQQTVLGEYAVARSVWVPDMQLSCGSPAQVAAMAVAILVGVPMLVGYWLLLLTLAWPKQTAMPAPGSVAKATPRVLRTLLHVWGLIKRACITPLTWLRRPVRTCQRYTSAAGLSGESCAALSVWNVEYRWWWLVAREVLKFAVVAAATLTAMRGPDEQARVLLLLVVAAAMVSWRVQAGCSTSMNQLQFMSWCWLQLLALLLVVPSMQGISAVGFGSAVLVLVGLVMLQCAVVCGCLVWRIIASCRNLHLLMRLEADSKASTRLTSVAEMKSG